MEGKVWSMQSPFMLTCNWLRSVWVTMVNVLHRGAFYCIETNVSRII